jgi:chorismate synthase
MKGSEHNDLYNSDGTTKINLSGGIQGGIVMEWIFILL